MESYLPNAPRFEINYGNATIKVRVGGTRFDFFLFLYLWSTVTKKKKKKIYGQQVKEERRD